MKTKKTLTVGLAENAYDILIGDGLLDEFGGLLKPLCSLSADALVASVAVVTDENVWREHGRRFASSLEVSGVAFKVTVLTPGERNKSMEGLAGLYDAFARQKLARNGLVVAFGGGVIGDLCGFAAATWMRGVRFVQAPTTLLAQVDSSVGGKTAVNLPQGKNMVGAFYQPELVVIDPLTLRTLPEREVKSGMAEVVKYGAIRSDALFRLLGTHVPPDGLSGIIYECCRIKSEIVARDERDFGERMLLNFGHTLGHAIEKIAGFERYRHGEAVAFGMVLAAAIGERMGLTEPGAADELERLLALYGIETRYTGDPAELTPILSTDKKSLGDVAQMVLLRRIGDAFVHRVDLAEISNALKEATETWTK
jgi:3-dehydroquinate synthase